MSSAVPLTQAVTSGDVKAVSAALATGADVDERNNGGQTALILAVIFGHTDLVRLLVQAGANPRLRDNLGLDAVEWAQRRGLPLDLFETRVEERPAPEPPIETDEKSRKWLAGVKQRIQEQAIHRQEPVVHAEPQRDPEPKPAPEPKRAREPEPEPAIAAPTSAPTAPTTSTTTRKRCPKCNAIYNSELIAYCAHHVVRLVDIDEPVFEPPASVASTITNTPLLWMLVLATVAIAAFTAYMISSQLSSIFIPDNQAAAAQQQPKSFIKGTPVAAGELADKTLKLAEAECPIFEGETRSRANAGTQTVSVHVKVDKSGKVYWARAQGADEAMRNAATDAATQSTFSPDKLRGRETEGTITYTFAP